MLLILLIISNSEGTINYTQFMIYYHHESLKIPSLIAFSFFVCLYTHTTLKFSPILKTNNHLNVLYLFFFAYAFVMWTFFNLHKWYCYITISVTMFLWPICIVMYNNKSVLCNCCVILSVLILPMHSPNSEHPVCTTLYHTLPQIKYMFLYESTWEFP